MIQGLLVATGVGMLAEAIFPTRKQQPTPTAAVLPSAAPTIPPHARHRRSEYRTSKIKFSKGGAVASRKGLAIELDGPLDELSGVYKWSHVPTILAIVRVLASGEERAMHTVDRVMRVATGGAPEQAGSAQMWQLAISHIYRDTKLVQEVTRLAAWGNELHESCPKKKARKRLRQLSVMTDDQAAAWLIQGLK